MGAVQSAADVAMSTAGLAWTFRWATQQKLRILAFHAVADPRAFERHMDHLADRYQPVSADQVCAAFDGETDLPDLAVWVTFDDGDPSVVDAALPILEARDIKATMFVCPGVIGTGDPLWWQTLAMCGEEGLLTSDGEELPVVKATAKAKQLPTTELEDWIRALVEVYESRTGGPPRVGQLQIRDLREWVARGHTVGNHTWMHPMLDRSDPDRQRAEILKAHEWLDSHFPGQPSLFAYPNGNATEFAEETLSDLRYSVGLLFDHRLSGLPQARFRMSRLRVSDLNTEKRFQAILAGVHPALHHVRLGLRIGIEPETAGNRV